MVKLVIVFICIANTLSAFAQPGTEIYLFDLKEKRDKLVISNPRNITNRKGYDNQPFFHPDKSILYFVSANEEGRTDIFEYNYKSKETKKFTQSHDKEYSPTVTPDKKFISCILQRDSGAQDLVKYPIEGGEPIIIIDNLIVGYHAWANTNAVTVFTLPRPFKLQFIDAATGGASVIAENIGRSLHKVPGKNAISFIQKVSDTDWDIKLLDSQTKAITAFAKSLSGIEHDMTWTPNGKILMSDEKKIFFMDVEKNNVWKETDLQFNETLNKITRMAVSPDGKTLAVVISEVN